MTEVVISYENLYKILIFTSVVTTENKALCVTLKKCMQGALTDS